jgi:hypothetical protein
MFEVFDCNHLVEQVIPIGYSFRVEFTGITIIACIFTHPTEAPRFNFMTMSGMYSQTRSTNTFLEDEEVAMLYAEAMRTYDPNPEPSLIYHEYVESFEYSVKYMTKIIEKIVENKSHIDSIYFLRSLISKGLEIEKITNLYEKLFNEEIEYRYMSAKAKIIQKRFKRAISNPEYALCRARLMREWEDMVY